MTPEGVRVKNDQTDWSVWSIFGRGNLVETDHLKRPERPLAILKVASRLFSEKGYLETTMGDIVATGEASKGAIYHYFSCKEDILFTILDDYMDLVLDGLADEIGSASTPEAKIRRVIRRHIDLYATHVHESKVLLKEARALPPAKLQPVLDKERRYYEIVSTILRSYLGPELDTRRLAPTTFILFGMMNWVFSWYDPAEEVPPAELSDLIATIFTSGVRGLAGPADRSSPSG